MLDKRKKTINELLMAMYINIPALNVIITTLAPSVSGKAMALLYIGITTVLILIQVQRSVRNLFIFKGLSLLSVALYISIVFLISFMGGHSNLSIIEFLVYPLLPLLFISRLEVRYRNVLMYCPVITFCGVFFLNRIFITTYDAISMGLSYAFLPPIIFSLVYLCTNRKHFIINICAILNMAYLVELILYGSRGPMVSIVLCMAMLFFINGSNNKIHFSKVRIVSGVVMIFFLIANFWNVIDLLNDISQSFGWNITFLNKMLILKEANDLNNGRTLIYQVASQLISSKPLLGYGIATFDYYTGMEYPHNFFIQMLFDIGIIGTSVVLIPVLRGVRKLMRREEDEIIFVLSIVCASIPGALFSGDLWKNALLWLTFSFLIKK